ncbi:MAG TPA: hypothetical protein ENK56_06560 [Chloroflexi bacterium]|nr:hypothetical protein [Chloroflexota bacterium]
MPYKPKAGGYRHRQLIAEALQDTDDTVEALRSLLPAANGEAKAILAEAIVMQYRNRRRLSEMLDIIGRQKGGNRTKT